MASFNASVSEENRSRETLEDGNRTRNQTVVPQYENGAFLPRNVGNGFHLAVLLSIVSSAIIIFMSIIFITSCLLKHVKKDERRRMERQRRKENEAYWQKMDQQEMREAFYSHKGRNNNINNNNSKPQQHSHHPIHQTAPNAQALTFKDLQTASRHHQQDYNFNIHSSRPPLDAMPHNSYMNTQTTFVLQPQLLTPRPSSGYNPTLQQSPWIHGSSPTPVVTQKDRYQEQLQRDSLFLCSDQHVGTELLDKLVLQLNRIYPQILTNREAQKFRNLSVPAATRLAELLSHLQEKGEEACHEFYRALHLHSEDLYLSLPTRVSRREAPELSGANPKPFYKELCVLNDRGPLFFLCCFSIALGLAFFHYHKEGKIVTGSSVFSYTVFELGQHARHILLSYSENRSKVE